MVCEDGRCSNDDGATNAGFLSDDDSNGSWGQPSVWYAEGGRTVDAPSPGSSISRTQDLTREAATLRSDRPQLKVAWRVACALPEFEAESLHHA